MREKKDFEANFKKRKEKAKKDGGKKPRKTRSQLMTYACRCHTMRTLCCDVTGTMCTEFKVRGFHEVKDSNSICKTCMCKCNTGVFIYRDIERMTTLQVEAQEAEAREILPNVDTRAGESLGNILRSSLMEGFDTLSNSKSKISENNVLAATATSMSRKQFESKELQHAIWLSLGTLSTKLRSTKMDVCKILNIGWKESQARENNSTRTNLGELFFCCMQTIYQLPF